MPTNPRNKILEKIADHILKESCPHCQNIVRDALITKEDGTHCRKYGEWLEANSSKCGECGEISK
jgi:phage FluMu protein Com